MAAEILRALGNAIGDRPCRAHTSDLRVYVEAAGPATFPDGSVICGDLEQHGPSPTATAVNPVVLVEVTSDSSEEYDTGMKFEHYRTIPSLREYVVVSHRERRIVVHRRAENESIPTLLRRATASWKRICTGRRAGKTIPMRLVDLRDAVAVALEGTGLLDEAEAIGSRRATCRGCSWASSGCCARSASPPRTWRRRFDSCTRCSVRRGEATSLCRKRTPSSRSTQRRTSDVMEAVIHVLRASLACGLDVAPTSPDTTPRPTVPSGSTIAASARCKRWDRLGY